METGEITGAQAGLNGDALIRIALNTIVENGGSADMDAIKRSVTERIQQNHPGKTLSKQGYDSLRAYVNRTAVQAGYIYKYDLQNPGWRITPQGQEFLRGTAEEPQTAEQVFNAETQVATQETVSIARWDAFEQFVLELMKRMHPNHAWYHQGRHKREERGLDLIGDRMGDGESHRIGVQVKLHQPNNQPSDAEWSKFLAGCFVRRVDAAIFVTSGVLGSQQRREAGEAEVRVLSGRMEINRFSTQHELPEFELYDEPEG